MPSVQYTSAIPASAQQLFEWHSRPGAFERLVPPWETIEIVERSSGGSIVNGAKLTVRLRQGPVSLKWTALHRDYIHGEQFRDEQVSGPFASWVHTHRFLPATEGDSSLQDHIDYSLPIATISQPIAGASVKRKLDGMFAFRHIRTRNDLMRHRQYDTGAPLKVAISGASGLVGNQLTAFLTTGGHTVKRLVRSAVKDPETEIHWDPAKGKLNPADLEGLDAIIHLAGASVAKRWTPSHKRAIYDSRVNGTRLLAETIARLDQKPGVFLSASAIGFYGDQGDTLLDEQSPAGGGFLADTCKAWESECAPARGAGVRTVNLRIGLVVTASGGALKQQLIPFKFGLGGPIGSGRQYQSWIALDDLIGACLHVIRNETISGAVNAVSPNPLTQGEFASVLGSVLKRPAFLPLPAAALKLLLGEMADELLLSSARVTPNALSSSGFQFHFDNLRDCLEFELGRLGPQHTPGSVL